ncbi:unnamed protein product, partial [Rotaria sordida]
MNSSTDLLLALSITNDNDVNNIGLVVNQSST